MVKINNETGLDFEKEIKDESEKKNEQLKQIDLLSLPVELKEQCRKAIIKNFEKETKEIKSKSGYNVVNKMHKRIEKLRGQRQAILNCLKQYYVKIEENVEMMGYKGKKVHINLPAVGKFEGYKFDYFISNNIVTKKEFDSNLELQKKSYSMDDVSNLLKATNKFMAELGCETYGNDFKLKIRTSDIIGPKYLLYDAGKAGDNLRDITGLDDGYRLSDKNIGSKLHLHAEFYFTKFNCFIIFSRRQNIAKLFIKMS